MNKLIIIPARAGSKGLPGKNTKELFGKPLCAYSIDFAREVCNEGDEICISTNDKDVIDVAVSMGLKVPFVRPEKYSVDTASSYDVIMHAINHYEEKGKKFESVLLLQPTTPVRYVEDFKKLNDLYHAGLDMVVTVKIPKENPYFSLFESNDEGYLVKSKPSDFTRRQDCPPVFAMNGSMYLMNIESLKKGELNEFKRIAKVVVSDIASIDIDTIEDWKLAEFRLQNI